MDDNTVKYFVDVHDVPVNPNTGELMQRGDIRTAWLPVQGQDRAAVVSTTALTEAGFSVKNRANNNFANNFERLRDDAVVYSSDRMQRASYRQLGIDTVCSPKFFSSKSKDLVYAMLSADSKDMLTAKLALMQRGVADAASGSFSVYLYITDHIEKYQREIAVLVVDRLFAKAYPDIEFIEQSHSEALSKHAVSVDQTDLFLVKNNSREPGKIDGAHWLKQFAVESGLSENESSYRWLVAVDDTVFIESITQHADGHGDALKLLELNHEHEAEHIEFNDPAHGFAKNIRSVLYDTINGRTTAEKIKLFYNIDETDYSKVISRHVRHDHNDDALNNIYKHLALKEFPSSLVTISKNTFSTDGMVLDNLIVQIRGRSSDIIFIACHTDSTSRTTCDGDVYDPANDPAPGVHDNGSGIAGALSCIDALAKLAKLDLPEKTIRIGFFNAEEVGVVGSRQYVRRAQEGGATIVAAYAMDMIGYSGIDGETKQFAELHWGYALDKKVEAQSMRLAEIFEQIAPEVSHLDSFEHHGGSRGDKAEGRSDHAAFHECSIPAVVVSHAFFSKEHSDPNYHSHRDTTIDTEYTANIARGIAASVWSVATDKGHAMEHGDHDLMVGHEHAGYHAMIVVGHKEVYLCHMINMGFAAHNYHYIIEVTLSDPDMKQYVELSRAHDGHDVDDCLIVGNLDPFTISDIVLGRITEYDVAIWSARIPSSFVPGMKWPWAKEPPLLKVRVKVKRIVHLRRFSSEDNYPDKLTYILFGNHEEAFLQHNQVKQPDFDQIVQITPPTSIALDFLSCANTVVVGGLPARPDGSLYCSPPIDAADLSVQLDFDFAAHAVIVDVVKNVWFSTQVVNFLYKGEVCT